MPYSHKRSKMSKERRSQKRVATSYVWQTSFNDRLIHEVVCVATPNQIDDHVKSMLAVDEPQVFFAESTGFQDGLILANQLQYEFIVNQPSNSHVSDLDKLTPIEKYQGYAADAPSPTYTKKVNVNVGWVGRQMLNVYGDVKVTQK